MISCTRSHIESSLSLELQHQRRHQHKRRQHSQQDENFNVAQQCRDCKRQEKRLANSFNASLLHETVMSGSGPGKGRTGVPKPARHKQGKEGGGQSKPVSGS